MQMDLKQRTINSVNQATLQPYIKEMIEMGGGCGFISIYRLFAHYSPHCNVKPVLDEFLLQFGQANVAVKPQDFLKFIQDNQLLLGFRVSAIEADEIMLMQLNDPSHETLYMGNSGVPFRAVEYFEINLENPSIVVLAKNREDKKGVIGHYWPATTAGGLEMLVSGDEDFTNQTENKGYEPIISFVTTPVSEF